MADGIERIGKDHARYKKIVEGKIRDELKRYISNNDFYGKQGKDTVKIPIKDITLPRFRFGQNGGVGQGPGDIGDLIFPNPGEGQGEDGEGEGDEAGQGAGDHILEEVSIEYLALLMGEEFGLPNIQPKDGQRVLSDKYRVRGIRNVGPESMRHFRRSYKNALKRAIASGTYDPHNPTVIVWPEDKKYKSMQVIPQPDTNAVIINMMDVSGSMSDEDKTLVRRTSFWINAWLATQYENLEQRFIIHDSEARVVDEHTYYHTRESGGTRCSSAYECCLELIGKEYPPELWNIYPFHYTDGDNYSSDDDYAMQLLRDELLPAVNLFCYGQCNTYDQRGHFLTELENNFRTNDEEAQVRTAVLQDTESIIKGIRRFLSTGR